MRFDDLGIIGLILDILRHFHAFLRRKYEMIIGLNHVLYNYTCYIDSNEEF